MKNIFVTVVVAVVMSVAAFLAGRYLPESGNSQLVEQNKNQGRHINNLTRELRQAQSNAADYELQVQAAKGRIQILESQVDLANVQVRAADVMRNKRQQELGDAKQRLSTLMTENSSLISRLTTTGEKAANLDGEKARLEQEQQSLNNLILDRQKEIESNQRDVKALAQRNDTLKASLKQTQELLVKSESEGKLNQTELGSALLELEKVNLDSNEVTQLLEKEKSAAKELSAKLDDARNQAKNLSSQSETEISALTDGIDTTRNQLEKLEVDLSLALTKNIDLTGRLEASEKSNGEQSLKMVSLTAELTEIKNAFELTESKLQLAEAASFLERVSIRFQSDEKILNKFETQLDELRQKIDLLEVSQVN
ncbi:MAG: chromosome segregation ATPase [Parasphingorhabdus sp.]